MYKVLIIAPSWVGDLVMSQTLFKMLRAKYGDSLVLDVFANSWASSILSRMPEVNNVIINPFQHKELAIIKRIKLGLSLRSKGYDQLFVLPNSIKSVIMPMFSKIAKRTGFVGEFRYGLLNEIYKLDKVKLPLMIDRFCALANNGNKPHHISYPKLLINRDNQLSLVAKFGININRPILIFCPAAEYGPAKRWPPDYFAQLANLNPNKQIIILGSSKDIKLSQEIIVNIKDKTQVFDLCGKTNLADAIDVIGLSQVVVTNDSGLMHIASAVDVEVIAIYGSSTPNFTPPLTKKAHILHLGLECSPCFARVCRFGHYNCLNQIKPQMINDLIN